MSKIKHEPQNNPNQELVNTNEAYENLLLGEAEIAVDIVEPQHDNADGNELAMVEVHRMEGTEE